MYKRCIHKKGMSSYLPIDAFNNRHLQDRATKLYTQLYVNFAKYEQQALANHSLC
jgi:protein MBA1